MMDKIEPKKNNNQKMPKMFDNNIETTYQLKKEFYLQLRNIEKYEQIQVLESACFQHGNTTVYKHSRNVAYLSIALAKKIEKKLHISFNYSNLLVGAFLHDMFLYDWHEKDASHRLHGYRHPLTASRNAKAMCHVNEEVEKIIQTHMWPLTITRVPKSREAFLVCLVDKYAAVIETLKR